MSWLIISNNDALEVNQKYLVDTTGGSITLTFPESPAVGDEIFLADFGDWSINSVFLETITIYPFSTGGETLELNRKQSQFQFIFDGSRWVVFNTSRPSIRISDLPIQASKDITDEDLLLYVDETSGALDTKKVSYSTLRQKLTEGVYDTPEEVISALNAYTGTPQLNAKIFNGQEPSFYLNYNNISNKPTIPSAVSQLANDSEFISDFSNFTTDNLAEGETNKYLTQDNFGEFFGDAFADAYRRVSGELSEDNITDSVDNAAVTASTVQVATNTVTLTDPNLSSSFSADQRVRIYGASETVTQTISRPTLSNIEKIGFTVEPPPPATSVGVRYKIAQFDFTTGSISDSSVNETQLLGIYTDQFNETNKVRLTFTRSSQNNGILVYRQTGTGSFLLIDVLGPKQLGTQLSNITYIDYYTFNYTSWSRKNVETGAYQTSTGIVHFPLIAPSSPRRGWVYGTINSVIGQTITLKNSYYFEASGVTISHDDTLFLQDAINQRSAAGVNSITLNDRRYIVSKLVLPTRFSIYGKGKQTNLKKLPWSIEEDNNVISAISSSMDSFTVSAISIDGNMQNQWLKNDSFNPFANYCVDVKENSVSTNIDKVQIANVIGGGISADTPEKFLLNLSRVENSGMSDFYEYSPLIADSGSDVIVTNNVFKNFTSAIDLSVTDNGIFASNAVQNVGSGVLVYSSTFFISSPNIIRGPAGEFIPGPDILNSAYDSVNITLEADTNYVSEVYQYQENGIDFDITANRASLAFKVDKLRKTNNVEELYGEILISASSPIVRVVDESLEADRGYFKFSITSTNVNQLLTTYSYTTLKAVDANHVGLVYRALLTEYVPSGNITAQSRSGTTYIVDLSNYKNLSLGAKVRLLDHGGTPNLNNLVGTITNINTTVPEVATVTIEYGETISANGSGGQLTVENTFVLAKGRIL